MRIRGTLEWSGSPESAAWFPGPPGFRADTACNAGAMPPRIDGS